MRCGLTSYNSTQTLSDASLFITHAASPLPPKIRELTGFNEVFSQLDAHETEMGRRNAALEKLEKEHAAAAEKGKDAIAEKKKQAIIAATEGIKNLEDVLNAFRAALTGFEIDRFFQARLDRFTECASQYAALQLAAAKKMVKGWEGALSGLGHGPRAHATVAKQATVSLNKAQLHGGQM